MSANKQRDGVLTLVVVATVILSLVCYLLFGVVAAPPTPATPSPSATTIAIMPSPSPSPSPTALALTVTTPLPTAVATLAPGQMPTLSIAYSTAEGVFLFDPVSGAGRKLADEPAARLFWSPDGAWLATTRHPFVDNNLRVLSLREPPKSYPQVYNFAFPVWSPDGDRILALPCPGTSGREGDFSVLDRLSGSQRVVTTHEIWPWLPNVAPDMRKALVVPFDCCPRALKPWVIFDDWNRAPLQLEDLQFPTCPDDYSWSADGRYLVYYSQGRFWVRDFQEMALAPRLIVGPATGEFHDSVAPAMAWSSDGQQLALVLKGDLWIADLRTLHARRVEGIHDVYSGVSWAPWPRRGEPSPSGVLQQLMSWLNPGDSNSLFVFSEGRTQPLLVLVSSEVVRRAPFALLDYGTRQLALAPQPKTVDCRPPVLLRLMPPALRLTTESVSNAGEALLTVTGGWYFFTCRGSLVYRWNGTQLELLEERREPVSSLPPPIPTPILRPTEVRPFIAEEKVIYSGGPYWASWSPAGDKLMFTKAVAGLNGADLYVIDPQGGAPQRIVHLSSVQAPSLPSDHRLLPDPIWSPSGKQILYTVAHRGGYNELWVAGVDGLRKTKIAEADPHSYLKWLKDGRIAFLRNGFLYTVDARGQNRSQLSRTKFADPLNVNLSPDGTKVVYVANGVLMLMNLDGTERKALGATISGQSVWSPDSGRLLYLQTARGSTSFESLWVVDRDGHEPIMLPDELIGPGWSYDLSWSPDSAWLSFGHTPTGTGTASEGLLFVTKHDGWGVHAIVIRGVYGGPTWSPDGSHLAYIRFSNPNDLNTTRLELVVARLRY